MEGTSDAMPEKRGGRWGRLEAVAVNRLIYLHHSKWPSGQLVDKGVPPPLRRRVKKSVVNGRIDAAGSDQPALVPNSQAGKNPAGGSSITLTLVMAG